MRTTIKKLVGCVLFSSAMASGAGWADDDMRTFAVTITNAMHANTLAPVMVATHKAGMSFFKVGEAPSDELAWLAEAGNAMPMAAMLMTDERVSDVKISSGGVPAGQSTTVVVSAPKGMTNVSIGSMIGKSNDAFAAVRDMPLPNGRDTVNYTAIGYDSGAESNDETMATVPACGLGVAAAGYSGTATGEGYVHVSNGIRGKDCLDADTLDWRNPVAFISIQRVYK